MPRKRKARPEPDNPDHEQATTEGGAHVDAGMKGNDCREEDGDEADNDNGCVQHFNIPFDNKSIVCERRGGKEGDEKLSLIFTHGAGGGITSPATKDFADGFAEVGDIVTFKGAMNLQSRVKTYRAVTEYLDFDPAPALGGRSMGARAAAICATAIHEEDRDRDRKTTKTKTKALVLVSFPLVGAKNKDSREQILLDIPAGIDVLFITGTRDSMCDAEHLAEVAVRMKASCWFVQVRDADHGMAWKGKDSSEVMRRKTGAIAAGWLAEEGRDATKRYGSVSWDEDAEDIDWSGWRENNEK
ncbi:Uu.00g125540.m01.CDS01 [Anthostomella pinea]|uniref:Uu.00g125540.m01.CDS01 n=1 Tax=Anthostomella pinea TaxID=933095 RepID=A0AAI8YHL3_9PEZI|nr:Uu.00g125540.m01.CDS01 [Anthostomella pinea]